MISCPICGTLNRSGARFCYHCATILTVARPSKEDIDWLDATLADRPASASSVQVQQIRMVKPMPDEASPANQASQGEVMEQTPPPETKPTLIAGRYEIVSQNDDQIEVLDRQPWQRCWSCGSATNEDGELFCTQCGASLDGRRYRGQYSTGEAQGLALVSQVQDDNARALLPPIWDQVQDGDKTLTLIADTARTALTPPLAELDALHIGQGLARLLKGLHAEGFALGVVEAGDLEMTASLAPQLRQVPQLHRMPEDRSAHTAADLKNLAKLLESLTETPRKTRRLDDDNAIENAEAPSLHDLLSDIRTGAFQDAAALEASFTALLEDRMAPRPMWTRIGASAHVGMQRELDEDSLLFSELRMIRKDQGQSWGLYIVSDGMGGHSAGEVASDLAIRGAYSIVQDEYLTPLIDADMLDEEARLKEIVRKAAIQANDYVVREAQNRANDMGATLTMALVAGDKAIVGNVGDSRTYLYRDGVLRRVSKDHSLVQRLVDLGQIEPDDVYTHPQRSAILRSLGDKHELKVDVFVERLKPGDALLLCSDGLWEMVRDQQIAEIIQSNDDPQKACEEMIIAANKAGGEDNITALLVRFEPYQMTAKP